MRNHSTAPNPILSFTWIGAAVGCAYAVLSMRTKPLDQKDAAITAETALETGPELSGVEAITMRMLDNEWCWLMAAIAIAALIYAIVQWAVIDFDRQRWQGLDSDHLPDDNGMLNSILLVLSGRRPGYGTKGAAPVRDTGAGRIDRDNLVERLYAGYQLVSMPLTYVVWLLPLMGFAGTVYGVSESISALRPLATEGSSALSSAMGGVLDGLHTAFDTTLLGIVLGVLVALLQQMQRVSGDRLIVAIQHNQSEA